MASPNWTYVFQSKIQKLQRGDTWRLEFDDSIVAESPAQEWKKYIRNTTARFKCSKCGRGWPSNRVMVLFHMQLRCGQGTVKVRLFRQNCKLCSDAPMEKPVITSQNTEVLLDKLMEKIRIKCYNEPPTNRNRPFERVNVQSPHEPDHCEGCILGVCTKE
ncbi:receptor-transporting protein 3 [Thalassophryne amazonica]|uniref:receptor-transporting protein 3 n=1 Tax=Thalassophryne amazonica TaxID=390379 RepID=UPI0014719E04|nr:receptor-transporting protein 3 [Thalassophryne amazonica]